MRTLLAAFVWLVSAVVFADRPNIILIVSDDAGYADFSMHGSKHFRTPRIDSIGKDGIRFSQGYVTCSVCSPSRAGLITGRYQQRFGHEFNIPPRYSETNGLPVEEVTMADLLKGAGYRTIALGKWHLGYAPKFHPLSRGFSDYFGFLQGARSYWSMKGTKLNRLLRDRKPIEEKFAYMTDELGKQAAKYIQETQAKPFFMYLCYNAVHTPMHATEADLAKVTGTHTVKRKKLAAMTLALDRSVGYVLDALRKSGVEKNTLVVFINDNGGATSNSSKNTPLRGHKGQVFEGGIRIPFCVKWPAKVRAGSEIKSPVSTLDLLPTFLSAAGVEAKLKNPLDGVDLLPAISGQAKFPRRTLFWRKGTNWAVRHHQWKLLHQGKDTLLFDLSKDARETTDVSSTNADMVKELRAKFAAWNKQLIDPRWRGLRRKKKK